MQETDFPPGRILQDSALSPLCHALVLHLATLSPQLSLTHSQSPNFFFHSLLHCFFCTSPWPLAPGMIFLGGAAANWERHQLFPSLVTSSGWAEPQALCSSTCHPLVMS